MMANSTSCSASQSTLAPTSSTAVTPLQGRPAGHDGRPLQIRRDIRRISLEIAIRAPVLPAETAAAASPCFTASTAFHMEVPLPRRMRLGGLLVHGDDLVGVADLADVAGSAACRPSRRRIAASSPCSRKRTSAPAVALDASRGRRRPRRAGRGLRPWRRARSRVGDVKSDVAPCAALRRRFRSRRATIAPPADGCNRAAVASGVSLRPARLKLLQHREGRDFLGSGGLHRTPRRACAGTGRAPAPGARPHRRPGRSSPSSSTSGRIVVVGIEVHLAASAPAASGCQPARRANRSAVDAARQRLQRDAAGLHQHGAEPARQPPAAVEPGLHGQLGRERRQARRSSVLGDRGRARPRRAPGHGSRPRRSGQAHGLAEGRRRQAHRPPRRPAQAGAVRRRQAAGPPAAARWPAHRRPARRASRRRPPRIDGARPGPSSASWSAGQDGRLIGLHPAVEGLAQLAHLLADREVADAHLAQGVVERRDIGVEQGLGDLAPASPCSLSRMTSSSTCRV